MNSGSSDDGSTLRGTAQFATTHWSVVLAAGRSSSPAAQEALESICRTYWPPLYAYVRRQGHDVEESKDLTQAFFARFIDRHYFGHASPQEGRFRTFLLTSLKHFLVNDWERARAQRRGGGQVPISLDAVMEYEGAWAGPVDQVTPETAYERQWASTLLQSVLSRLEQEQASAGSSELFEALESRLWGAEEAESYEQLAQRLGQKEGALRTAAHRLRHRYGDLLREEIAHTVADANEIDDELRHLITVLGRNA
jgi:RNA polymerase sigma-70 factor (ECF subfamily)